MRLKTLGIWFAISLVAGCAGTTDPIKIAAQQKEGSAQIAARKQQKGSLLLVRIIESGLFGTVHCGGLITLRKLNAGRPDETERPINFSGAVPYNPPNRNKLYISNIFPVSPKDYATEFVPIAPGRYAITHVACSTGEIELEAGDDKRGIFGGEPTHISALGGESTITIGENQIVDAGYIEVSGMRRDAARVTATEATPAERDLMKRVIPDVYPSITFTKFGS